jgi:hypothetical protein
MFLLKQLKQISGDKELLFLGDHDATKIMNENTVNRALRASVYDTITEVCEHGLERFRVVLWVSRSYGATKR